MTNARSLQGIIVLIAALVAAIWLGLSIVTSQEETIIKILGVIILIVCFGLGRKIWLLIPFTAALSVSLRIPGQPDTLLLGQLLVIGFSTALFLMRKLPYQFRWTELEVWVVILTLFVIQVYFRNPVGLNFFGGDTVGGKAYVIYGITLASALILSGLKVPVSDLKWVFRLSVIGGLMNLVVSVAGILIPALGYYTQLSYERSDEVNHTSAGQTVDAGQATRVGFSTTFAKNLALWISSCISPLKACIHPLWGALILIALVSAMLGGFRNGVGFVGFTFLLGIFYRGGLPNIALSMLAGIAGITLLGSINLISPLPPNVQRSLAFLPGTWDERYKKDTEVSNEWRYDIWREVLLTDRWIKNKWLGDGLGFSAAELAAQINSREGARAGISGFDAHRESILVSGDYHSGPVQTVRVIGYLGLVALVLAQIRLGVHAHRQIKRCKGTEWYPLALFIGIPLVISPVFFVFVFGLFKTGAANLMLGAAMVRMLQNNLPLPK